VLSALAICPLAQAVTYVNRDTAPELAAVIARDPGSVTSASFVSLPTSGEPNAVVDSYGPNVVPRHGTEMSVLSNGDARIPSDPGYPGRSTDLAGGDTRGGDDVTILRLEVDVPAAANCLTLAFDFFTMDFDFIPQPGQEGKFHDSFLAELDRRSPGASRTAGPAQPRRQTSPSTTSVDP
jgi:hypothetical protein